MGSRPFLAKFYYGRKKCNREGAKDAKKNAKNVVALLFLFAFYFVLSRLGWL